MKAVLFDWDGVLVDSTEMYYNVYCELSTHYDKYLPIHSVDEFRAWYNSNWENNYYEMGFTEADLPMIADFVHAHIDYAPLSLFPGVAEVLADLKRDYTIAIVSTTPREVILARLQAEGLDKYIDYITGNGGTSEKVTKIAETMRQINCTEAVMIGDTPVDITSGQANNLPTIGATYGWVSPERVRAANPTRTVDSALELSSAIRALLQ